MRDPWFEIRTVRSIANTLQLLQLHRTVFHLLNTWLPRYSHILTDLVSTIAWKSHRWCQQQRHRQHPLRSWYILVEDIMILGGNNRSCSSRYDWDTPLRDRNGSSPCVGHRIASERLVRLLRSVQQWLVETIDSVLIQLRVHWESDDQRRVMCTERWQNKTDCGHWRSRRSSRNRHLLLVEELEQQRFYHWPGNQVHRAVSSNRDRIIDNVYLWRDNWNRNGSRSAMHSFHVGWRKCVDRWIPHSSRRCTKSVFDHPWCATDRQRCSTSDNHWLTIARSRHCREDRPTTRVDRYPWRVDLWWCWMDLRHLFFVDDEYSRENSPRAIGQQRPHSRWQWFPHTPLLLVLPSTKWYDTRYYRTRCSIDNQKIRRKDKDDKYLKANKDVRHGTSLPMNDPSIWDLLPIWTRWKASEQRMDSLAIRAVCRGSINFRRDV